MMIETQAIYENGVLRPTTPLPLQENQAVSVMIDAGLSWLDEMADWEFIEKCQDEAEEAPTLEQVRTILAALSDSLSQAVIDERGQARY